MERGNPMEELIGAERDSQGSPAFPCSTLIQ